MVDSDSPCDDITKDVYKWIKKKINEDNEEST